MSISVLNREIIISRPIAKTIGVVVFVLLTTLGAFVRIPLPFTPVPLTLQTFFVLLSGLMLGANCGLVSQLIYLTLGASGLTVFAGGFSGLPYLFGPTGGYLFGFLLASFLIGKLTENRSLDIIAVLAILITGSLIILLTGSLWLMIGYRFSLNAAIYAGLIPFIGGDILKSVFASLIYFNLKRRQR